MYGFRTDSGGDYGLGHFVRCQRLTEGALDRGIPVRFWVARCHDDGLSWLEERNIPVTMLKDPFEVPRGDIALDRVPEGVPNWMVVDSLHRDCLADLPRFAESLCRLSASVPVALLDGGGRHAVRTRLPWESFDLAIAPYAGEEDGPGVLAGAAYCVLGAEYENLPARRCANPARNVLVTFGGTDPFDMTAWAVNSLANVEGSPLRIRVIVGAGFADDVRANVARAAETSRHDVTLVDAPRSLLPHIDWADLAVASSGLTKYEFAACGLPSVLVSIDEDHWEINKAFLAAGTAWDGGAAGQLDGRTLARRVADMIVDAPLRQQMADRGQALVDGAGTRRILDELETEIDPR